MRFHYISPSTLPSRTANSVHVIMQCDALARCGAEITLYAKRAMTEEGKLMGELHRIYGTLHSRLRLVSYHADSALADNLRIASLALVTMHRHTWPDAILSRNLYASYVIGVLERRPLIFETHQLEEGMRGHMQRALMTRPWVTTIVVSNRLKICLEEHHRTGVRRPLILHDAAQEGISPLPQEERRATLIRLIPSVTFEWQAICGYFGQLYAGRGVEIIERLAAARPEILFLVFGGNDDEIARRRTENRLSNLHFMGHIPHTTAQQCMLAVDILLMPYQESVSIGVKNHDTARWMSPIKMFEYMASGVPIIASDLPALREVLYDEENCLLATPSDATAWLTALDKLLQSPNLAHAIGRRGHEDYEREYTWTRRAQRILSAAESLG